MNFPLVSTTELQKNAKRVLNQHPIQVILTNNKVSGLLFSGEVATYLLDSDLLQQLREELWEVTDKTTRDLIAKGRTGTGSPISVKDFRKKYGV